MCICLARGGLGGVGVRGLGLGFTNPGRTGEGVIGVCVMVAVVWVLLGEDWVGGLVQGLGGWC